MKRLVPQPGTDLYVEMQAKVPRHRNQDGNELNNPSEWDLAELQDVQNYDPRDDLRLHGGVGYGRMLLTLFGAGWTTIRVIFAFALILSTTVDLQRSAPDPWSVVVLLIVCQIYMSSRGFPRAINLLMALNILLMSIAVILSSWGPRANTNYYAKMEVIGGNCPFFWHNDCPLSSDTTRINSNMTVIGCLTNSTWDQAAEGYPREAFWDTNDNPDPNHFTSMNINRHVSSQFLHDSELTLHRMFVKYGGLVLAIFSLLWTSYLVIRTQPWRDMMHPFPELRMARFGNFANSMAHISYAAMWIFILWALFGHVFDEVSPYNMTYVDGFGPAVNTNVFTATPGSAGWNQSHDGLGADAIFLGGNATTWSDCFDISPNRSASGHFTQWWNEKESKALRILAQL